MNYRMVFKSLGAVSLIIGGFMIFPVIVSVIYGQGDWKAFLISMAISGIIGAVFLSIKVKNSDIYGKDGFAIVALGWLLISLLGALPLILSGVAPSFTDAFFESASGFSTTGSTIITNIEAAPKGIIFWRSFANLIGGMGVLLIVIAILPWIKGNALHIMKAETTGPSPEKFAPKIQQTAKLLYIIYFCLTAIQIIFLLLGGMDLFDAIIHSFSTAGTGGFSSKNTSIGFYNSSYINNVITIFMFLFGVNYTLFYGVIFKKSFKSLYKDEELRLYALIVIISSVLIAININGEFFNTIGKSLEHSFFQVVSIITTTGYSTTDFNLWGTLSKGILLLVMFIGASAGSTSGGIKCIKILLLFKMIKREIIRMIHPKSVHIIKYNGKQVEEESLSAITIFFFLYMLIIAVAAIIISLDGKDLITTFSSVIAAVSNVGPALGEAGPMGSFANFSPLSKWTLSLCMIIGRLEIYPMILLLIPSFWKPANI